MADKKWSNPVRSQMDPGGRRAPSITPATPGVCMDHNPDVPFSKPHDTGNGGIPLKFMEMQNMTGKAAKITMHTPGTEAGLSAPSAQGPVRPVSHVSPPSNRK